MQHRLQTSVQTPLWHCGKCHTPKQAEVFFMGQRLTPFCMCSCKAAEVQREKERQAEQERLQAIERIREAAFPAYSDYGQMTFDISEDSKLVQAAKNYVDKFDEFQRRGKGLLFYGSCGTGKTHLAACIANSLIDKGIRVKFTTMPKIVNQLQSSFEGRDRLFDELRSVPLLIIDDFKAERSSEFMQETVFEVINGRAEACLPLIVTTNLTNAELKGHHDRATDRILSRVLGITVPIEVEGADRRRERIKEDYAADTEMFRSTNFSDTNMKIPCGHVYIDGETISSQLINSSRQIPFE